MMTDLIKLRTAFDAATADDNAASIVLAFFILLMLSLLEIMKKLPVFPPFSVLLPLYSHFFSLRILG